MFASSFYIIIVVLIAILGMLSKSALVVREDQRVLLFRLGRFSTVMHPGFHLTLPFIDTFKLVSLDSALPGWKGLSSTEILDRVVETQLGKEVLNDWIARGRKPLREM
ncbi:MAG: hypothetical protein QY326_10095 [Bdellovibrionota bacterium]|nr:MAG: hypothetical protein QY326_10095 [Bdellovibrionota bacterium]